MDILVMQVLQCLLLLSCLRGQAHAETLFPLAQHDLQALS